MSKRCSAVLFALTLVAGACASSGPRTGRDPNFLSRADIESVNVSNLYDVVQRLRPRWLSVRNDRSFGVATNVVVYQDQSFLGTPEVLRQLGRETAESMRYLDGPRASGTLPGLGSRHVEGAIVIEPRVH